MLHQIKNDIIKLILCSNLLLLYPFSQLQDVQAQPQEAQQAKVNSFSWRYYGDFYYGRAPLQDIKEMPYFVSSYRLNEISTNLQVLDFKYELPSLKVRFTPGIGDYLKKNYANEPAWARHMIEAKVAYELSKKLGLWIEGGVMNSPYTPETPTSWDHALYTRSLAPEYVPYYLEGIRLWMPFLDERLWVNLYLLSGWQHIQDNNRYPAFGWDIEWRMVKHSFHFTGFYGSEYSKQTPQLGVRKFFDFQYLYQSKKLWLSSDLYFGVQEIQSQVKDHLWGQANLQMRYQLTPIYAISSRLEYFYDPHQVQVALSTIPFNTQTYMNDGFKTASFSLGFLWQLHENLRLRIEGRQFFLGSSNAWSGKTLSNQSTDTLWILTNLTLMF
jgi:hypothetical protein